MYPVNVYINMFNVSCHQELFPLYVSSRKCSDWSLCTAIRLPIFCNILYLRSQISVVHFVYNNWVWYCGRFPSVLFVFTQ